MIDRPLACFRPAPQPGARRCSAALLAAVVLLAGGCGGGEGGGGSGPSLVIDPSTIRGEVMETGTLPSHTISGMVAGDVAALAGKTIYVVIEDPDALVKTSSLSYQDPDRFWLSLTLRPFPTPGHLQGVLRITASLDPQGRQPLAGTPFEVPYDVTVLGGLQLDATTLAVDAVFGDAPTRSIKATLAETTTSWVATVVTPYVPNVPRSLKVEQQPDGTMTITLFPMAPGTYTEQLRVASTVRHAGTTYQFSREIPVTYTVAPNDAILAVVYPARADVTRTQGDRLGSAVGYRVVTNTGVTSSWHGQEYLSSPPAASGTGQVNNWLYYSPSPTVYTCFTTGGVTECLPAGSYAARVHHVLLKNGVVVGDIYFPVDLTIVP